jgi:surface carbohydrate biosynthesis protein
MKKSTVFLPIETMSREYQYKLALAAKLANLGVRVVIGHAPYLDKIYKQFKGGVYIGKNIFKTLFPTCLNTFNGYKLKGWSILHLDEEGAIFAGRENEWKQELDGRLDPNVLTDDDKVFCWGDFQTEYYQSRLKQNSNLNILSTGQPKFCYQDEVYSSVLDIDFDEKFILFNMNYSVFNEQMGMTHFLESEDIYRKDTAENYKYKRSIWLDQLTNFGSILSVLNRMIQDKDFEQFKFVVRPHPAENEAVYESFFKDNSRVIVTNSHTAIEWSRKSFCTIHDGCTTGVEAFLSGCKVINYREQCRDHLAVNLIPNSVGLTAKNYEELKEKIELSAALNVNNEAFCKIMIANFDSDINSFELVINEVISSLKSKEKGDISLNLRLTDIYNDILSTLKYLPRKFLKNKEAYYIREKKKFSGFQLLNVKTKLDSINKVDGYNVKLKKFNKNYFILE